jgi:hypothetical protein
MLICYSYIGRGANLKLLPKPEEIRETFIVLPKVALAEATAQTYGVIGPAQQVARDFPDLAPILPGIRRITVDGVNLENPTVIAARRSHAEILNEFECLAYVSDQNFEFPVSDEIFGKYLVVNLQDRGKDTWIYLDDYIAFGRAEDIAHIRTERFPQDYKIWDKDGVAESSLVIPSVPSLDIYRALTKCISG